MDKEYLNDYLIGENEKFNKFSRKCHPDDLNTSYPDKSRFIKLKEPVGMAYPNVSLWPQIPLFGSLIIPISPYPENVGIEKKDLEKLLDFCKDTGKVQFILNGSPESFNGSDLDFLSPLFEELHPPILYSTPNRYMSEIKELKNYMIEFYTFMDLPSQTGMNCIDYFKEIVKITGTHYTPEEFIIENRNYYAFLKGYGYSEITEYFEKLLLLDSGKAIKFLSSFGKLIIDPRLNAIKSDYIFPKNLFEMGSFFNRSNSIDKTNNIHEIGEFLLNKLTFMPESFDACKDVIARYDQEDLYKVSASLHKGINELNSNLICKKNEELSQILDNVWSDGITEKRIKGISHGIPITMALIGTLAAGPVGGIGGLLSGLGGNVISEIVGVDQGAISEYLAKKTIPNHIVNIFDFKKKYNIDKM